MSELGPICEKLALSTCFPGCPRTLNGAPRTSVRIIASRRRPHARVDAALAPRASTFDPRVTMSATKILWGQIVVVFAIVLTTTWAATQWVAWKLGFQPQLGHPWFELTSGVPVCLPPAFFWWWYAYDAYAPRVFVEGCVYRKPYPGLLSEESAKLAR